MLARMVFGSLAAFIPFLISIAAAAPEAAKPMESPDRIVRLTDDGIEPQPFVTKPDERLIFFLNDTPDSVTTLAVDFKGHNFHCATGPTEKKDDGTILFKEPFGPSEFVATCFPEAGSYGFTVYGLKKGPDGVKGEITVK